MAPSRGEFVDSVPSKITQVNAVDQITTEDSNSSTTHFHKRKEQNEVSLKSLLTNEQEDSDKKQDSSAFEAVQGGNMLPDKITGNVSEKDETSLPTVSPVRRINRRIRVYKRKRRKVDTRVEHVRQKDIPDDSILRLWELFQSSDDMDVEFLGFDELKGWTGLIAFSNTTHV